jgi:hypothetical protein
MDNNSLTTAGVTAALTASAGILYKIYMVVNKKRCKSRCCNLDFENSIDIGDITPPEHTVVNIPKENFIQNPMQK